MEIQKLLVHDLKVAWMKCPSQNVYSKKRSSKDENLGREP